jgi:4-amino-4-deoxychorismate lyase
LAFACSPTPPLSLSDLYPTGETGGLKASVKETSWKFILDTNATASSSYTSFKTTSRDMYADARERVGITSFVEPNEVIMYNPDGEVMEGSLTSMYVNVDGTWLTPALTSGGQGGTTRRWALENDLCEEHVVTVKMIKRHREMCVSNGVRGFFYGELQE